MVFNKDTTYAKKNINLNLQFYSQQIYKVKYLIDKSNKNNFIFILRALILSKNPNCYFSIVPFDMK
jgi:hypothetical protein